jgi:hypothetical protein
MEDPEAIELVEFALRKKLEEIAAKARFYADPQAGKSVKILQLSQLKPSLAEGRFRSTDRSSLWDRRNRRWSLSAGLRNELLAMNETFLNAPISSRVARLESAEGVQ